jgi:hypothetical protein
MTGPNVSSPWQAICRGDVFQDGRLVEVGTEVGRALPPASTRRTVFDGVRTCSSTVASCSAEMSEPMSMPHSWPAPSTHPLGALDELGDEVVVDLLGRSRAARSTRTAGHRWRRPPARRPRPPGRGRRRLEHEDGVLAAEFEGAADEPLGALGGDDLAGGRRTGEAHVVGVLDHRCAEHPALTGHHLPQPTGEPGLLEQLQSEQCENGVWWSGLDTTPLPAARAAMPSTIAMVNG